MKRLLGALCLVAMAAGCGEGDDLSDSISLEQAALNGQSKGPLTRKTFTDPSESSREADTSVYYASASALPGTSLTIATGIPTLSSFRSLYGFTASSEVITTYYNRGDLGIGREMHCVNNLGSRGMIACYVRNFAAGDEKSPFQFGLSADIAFRNMHANHPFATVAMAFLPFASANQVVFAVYDANDNLSSVAPLDRYGIAFDTAFNDPTTFHNPGPQFGTPGVDFNNHIPSNCIACHGGTYDQARHSTTAALFLPFDLAQFEFETPPGTPELQAFLHQNEMVRLVANTSSTTGGASIVEQLDTWYRNPTQLPVFGNAFDTTQVVSRWQNGGMDIYQSVVRRACRNCHMAQSVLTFADKASFDNAASQIAGDLCNYAMPHSLQTLREFWLSSGPQALGAYFTSIGQSAAANQLAGCGPGNVATLDPQHIQATLVNLL